MCTPPIASPRLSHPPTCTPNLRISHLHKHHTWRLLYSLLILPSNPQGQTRRLLPYVSFKTPYAKTPHPLNHFSWRIIPYQAKAKHGETCELGPNDPGSEKTLEDQTSKAQKVLAKVKRVTPGLTARDCAFFSTQTSLV
jgi:hypothetical protein